MLLINVLIAFYERVTHENNNYYVHYLNYIVSDLVVARNCCMPIMLPGEAELVSV